MTTLDKRKEGRPPPTAERMKLRQAKARSRLQEWNDAVDPLAATPLHSQVLAIVLRHVTSGELSPGDLLPPEKDVASRLGISRTTVRHAYADLAADGWLVRTAGRGSILTRASSRPSLVVDPTQGFTSSFADRGDTRTEQVNTESVTAPPADVRTFFNDEPFALQREVVRSVGGIPVGCCSWWRTASCPSETTDAIEATSPRCPEDGVLVAAPGTPCTTVRASRADAVVAQLLGVPLRSPVLEVHTLNLDEALPVAYVLARWRADMVVILAPSTS